MRESGESRSMIFLCGLGQFGDGCNNLFPGNRVTVITGKYYTYNYTYKIVWVICVASSLKKFIVADLVILGEHDETQKK